MTRTARFERERREGRILTRSPLSELTDAEEAMRLATDRQGLAYLLYRDGDGHIHTRALDRERLEVGRSESADVALPWDRAVSRRHAAFEWEEGWWIVDDGQSTNGTLVNGERIRGRQYLGDRDLVQVGESAIAFCLPAAVASQ